MDNHVFCLRFLMAGTVTMVAPICALAQSQDAITHPPITANVHELSNVTTTETATVIHVDQQSRLVTLQGPKAEKFTVEAGDHVKNLDQVHDGDQISVRYQQAVALEILPADSADQPGVETESALTNADKGQTPGGTYEHAVTTTSTLTGIDLKKHTVSLKGPEGDDRIITVTDPARQAKLATLKVGDKVRITFVEAVAVQVTPKAKNTRHT
jgi:hypothetical protein